MSAPWMPRIRLGAIAFVYNACVSVSYLQRREGCSLKRTSPFLSPSTPGSQSALQLPKLVAALETCYWSTLGSTQPQSGRKLQSGRHFRAAVIYWHPPGQNQSSGLWVTDSLSLEAWCVKDSQTAEGFLGFWTSVPQGSHDRYLFLFTSSRWRMSQIKLQFMVQFPLPVFHRLLLLLDGNSHGFVRTGPRREEGCLLEIRKRSWRDRHLASELCFWNTYCRRQ